MPLLFFFLLDCFTHGSCSTGDRILWDLEAPSSPVSASLFTGEFGILEALAGRMERPVKPSGEEEEGLSLSSSPGKWE